MRAHSTTNTSTTTRTLLRAVIVIAAILALLVVDSPAQARATSRSHVSWAPHIQRKIIPTRSTSLGMQIATWYGPGFWGHGTACGGKLTPGRWGIAHRTLPCGTLVTLAYHGRRVTVPVIDRGPYSGANIDLTERTKRFLHFTSGSVRMTQVRHYRLLPKPAPRQVGTFAAHG